MSNFLSRRGLSAGIALLMMGCLGCGTGEYEKRLNGAVRQIQQNSVFREMKATPISGTPITIMIPNFFEGQPLVEGATADGAPVDPRRIHPPGVNIAGLKLTYEGSKVDGAGGKMSYYCYLGVADMASLGGKDLAMQMYRQAHSAAPDSTIPPTVVQCETPEGSSNEWKKLRSTGQQEFYYVDKAGKADFRKMDGVLEFYMRVEGTYMVTIGWHVPTAITGPEFVGLQTWAPRVAGSVVLKQ